MKKIKSLIYTIGYSPHTIDSFLEVLKIYSIAALVDVRSMPYSSYRPEFNYSNLKRILPDHGIEYIFLGRELGARFDDDSVYIDGMADYERIAEHHLFHEGMERLDELAKNDSVVLMCAEKDPLICHRTILISRQLKSRYQIFHILSDESLEKHEDTEKRLLILFGLDRPELPIVGRSIETKLKIAYSKQGKKIAYKRKKAAKSCPA